MSQEIDWTESESRFLTLTGNPFDGLVRDLTKDIVDFIETRHRGGKHVYTASMGMQEGLDWSALAVALAFMLLGCGYAGAEVRFRSLTNDAVGLEVTLQRLS